MNKYKEYKENLNKLIEEGWNLYWFSISKITDDPQVKKYVRLRLGEFENLMNKYGMNFQDLYQDWYSEALECIRQLLPSRLEDFVSYYKPPKNRKEIFVDNYTISDALRGLYIKNGFGKEIVGPKCFIRLFSQQIRILESAQKKFKSTLFNIRTLLQADLFDNELDAAEELKRKGFLRAAGMLAGVVLESHLKETCIKHNIFIKKTKPTINDFNNALKDSDVIDVPVWRNIQYLADIRNLCHHKKEREPKKQEIDDLISGIRKVLKTLF